MKVLFASLAFLFAIAGPALVLAQEVEEVAGLEKHCRKSLKEGLICEYYLVPISLEAEPPALGHRGRCTEDELARDYTDTRRCFGSVRFDRWCGDYCRAPEMKIME